MGKMYLNGHLYGGSIGIDDGEPMLPNEYQRVKYLDFTPSIGIIVTIPSTGHIIFTADFSSDKTSGSQSDVFGYRLQETSNMDFQLGVSTSSRLYNYIRTPGNGIGLSDLSSESYRAQDRVKASILLINPRPMALIGKYAYGYSSAGVDNYAFDGKFYELTARNIVTNKLVGWFVPCYRKSDNQVGVYDHIEKVFYYETYAAGSDYNIVAGPEIY